MPRRPAASRKANTPSPNHGKASQRDRLVSGMIAVANREGYAGASVSEVISEAGVSRPTFYEHFEDRDACFIAAMLSVQERLLADVCDALAGGAPERAFVAALEATVAFARSQPADARFVMKEALAGGPRALKERDRAISDTAKLIDDRFRLAPKTARIPDVPTAAMLGAIHRLLASRLRRNERFLDGLEADLVAWVESYGAPARKQRRGALSPLAAAARSPHLPATTLRAPPKLGPGRSRLSEEEVAENHRQRIMFATARVVQERGYSAATVLEITRRAGVDGRRFYRLFTEKEEAFSAVHELGFRYLMAAMAGAYFAGGSWAERIWEAFRAATQSVDEAPTFAHVAFVEAYAVGPHAIQRVEDSRIAFTIFLQEGYLDQPEGRAPPPRLALEAIVTAVFEIIYLQTRASPQPATAGLLGHIVHICLTPFIGGEAADEFLSSRAAARSSRAGRGTASGR